jgi:hypothetical protein
MDNLVSMKGKREDPEKPGLPTLTGQVWHKLDDSFEQPLIQVHGRFLTEDCGFGGSHRAELIASIWSSMLYEHMREITYMGYEAGITLSVGNGRYDV